ncbi:unnamed protein product [Adineta steineri]|uniref:Uncharacterized protein n=1 Tax=Adineta steineri TaxID=433720 RepID=A0A813M4H7_9BILA|nr:unnamed protein product [Adineta steineri]CAF1346862.1 unnamed protein product [Adineta steineri]CAF3613156.1 unnamed protein product [Adineta steineri]CAF4005838.1 unnamed protein product [Adineta steineri]
MNNIIKVEIRLMFLQIGPIETQFERYTADIAIEARWLATPNFLSSINEHDRYILSCGHAVRLLNYRDDENNWYPQLIIMNTNVDPDNQHIRYSLRKDRINGLYYMREHRLVKGFFYSPFNFHHFPHDIQELRISFGSSESGTKIKLEAASDIASGINTQAFISLHEWILYEHVESCIRKVKGFSFQTDEDGELDVPGHEKERSILTISCHVARRSKYMFWNGYWISFIMTIIGFAAFSITADNTNQRLGVAFTLILTHIAFRWTICVSHLTPPIAYLTALDKYSIGSMFFVILLGAWHAIIGSLLFTYNWQSTPDPSNYWLWIDRYILFTFAGIYIIAHIILIIWFLIVPFGLRRKMQLKDKIYRESLPQCSTITYSS